MSKFDFASYRRPFLRAVARLAANEPLGFADAKAVQAELGVDNRQFSDIVLHCLQRGDLDNQCPMGSIKLSYSGEREAS